MSDDELYALIVRVSALYAQCYGKAPRIDSEGQVRFLSYCLSRTGAESLMTPREILRDYMTVLNILMQNPDTDFDTLLARVAGESAPAPDEEAEAAVPARESRAAFDPNDIIL